MNFVYLISDRLTDIHVGTVKTILANNWRQFLLQHFLKNKFVCV